MPLYSVADALGYLTDYDNEVDDGREPAAKVNIVELDGDQLQVTFTPFNDSGSTGEVHAEVFIGTFRRATADDMEQV